MAVLVRYLILLSAFSLIGCGTLFKSKPQSKNDSESSPLVSAGEKTDKASDKADSATKKLEDKGSERDSKLKANISNARSANESNPEGAPKQVVDSELEIAQARLSDVVEDPEETAEGLRRKAAFEAGRSAEARKLTEEAVKNALKASEELAVLRKERDEALVERDLARASEKKARDEFIKQMAANRAANERAVREALDEQKNEFLRNMGYALIACGALCVGVGIISAYAKFKTGDIIKAGIVAAFWLGGAVFFFVCAWTINQWWFKWVVIIGGALCVTAFVILFITEHSDAKEKRKRLAEADEAEETLLEIQTVLDTMPKGDKLFQELSAKLDRRHKALLNELKAEKQRASTPAT